MKEANEELESFAYSVSHDLRAPLRAMDGFSRALVEEAGPALPAEAAGYAERISVAAARMGRLIDDLLRLSRVGRADLAHATFDLTVVAAEVVGALREAEPERAVEVEITPDLVVVGDPGLLRQLLENLLGNAWKFTRERPVAHIAFTGECRDGMMHLQVRDDGVGFDMAYAGKLFRAFERLHTEAEFSGTGIGLATAQRVVRRHGGRIRAEGAPGKGAVFSFELPCPEGGPG